MTLDTVTLSWRRPDVLRSCLLAILENTSDRLRHMYVVVNEAQPHHSRLLGISDKIKLILLPQNEGVVARNYALKISDADYIGQVDDDVIVNPAWDEKAFDMIGQDVQGVGDDGSWVIPDLSNFCLPDKKPQHGDFCDVLAGYCWIFQNGRFLYDESFGKHWHEETAIQFTMREYGYRFKRCIGMCRHEHRGKPNYWMEYHDPNIKKIQAKWLHRIDELHLEVPKK